MALGVVGGDGDGAGRGGAERLVPIRQLHDALLTNTARRNNRHLPRFAPRPGYLTGMEVFDGMNRVASWRPLWVDVPASSTSPGEPGQVAHDGTYLYFCLAVNTWRRVAHSTF